MICDRMIGFGRMKIATGKREKKNVFLVFNNNDLVLVTSIAEKMIFDYFYLHRKTNDLSYKQNDLPRNICSSVFRFHFIASYYSTIH